MTVLSDEEKRELKRKLDSAKKWKYFWDRLFLIIRISLKIVYIILFLISFVYSLSDHNISKDVIYAMNKISPQVIK